MELNGWTEVCTAEEIALEDIVRFDCGDRTYAIYRTASGDYYATDGYCTHQQVHLEGGLVMGNLIECPKHNGRFDIPTGEARRPAACIRLQTYPVHLSGDKLYMKID